MKTSEYTSEYLYRPAVSASTRHPKPHRKPRRNHHPPAGPHLHPSALSPHLHPPRHDPRRPLASPRGPNDPLRLAQAAFPSPWRQNTRHDVRGLYLPNRRRRTISRRLWLGLAVQPAGLWALYVSAVLPRQRGGQLLRRNSTLRLGETGKSGRVRGAAATQSDLVVSSAPRGGVDARPDVSGVDVAAFGEPGRGNGGRLSLCSRGVS